MRLCGYLKEMIRESDRVAENFSSEKKIKDLRFSNYSLPDCALPLRLFTVSATVLANCLW